MHLQSVQQQPSRESIASTARRLTRDIFVFFIDLRDSALSGWGNKKP